MSQFVHEHAKGINAALASAFFLGLSPIFGKLAINFGLPPLGVVGLRTLFATCLMLLVMFIFKRAFFYIYPAGLLGCLLAGGINGVGSLLYYGALGRIDASLGQIIFALYPLFMVLWLWLDQQDASRLTLFRLFLVLPALFLLISTSNQKVDILGVVMMIGASALYALHLPINQRVLYEMPTPTVTFYTLLAMSLIVIPAMLFSRPTSAPSPQAWEALIVLTLLTFFARLTLFTGVKHLGWLQTALLGLGELLITVLFAHLWLSERLNIYQWLGVAILIISLVLVKFEKPPKKRQAVGGWLSWLSPPGITQDIPWQSHE